MLIRGGFRKLRFLRFVNSKRRFARLPAPVISTGYRVLKRPEQPAARIRPTTPPASRNDEMRDGLLFTQVEWGHGRRKPWSYRCRGCLYATISRSVLLSFLSVCWPDVAGTTRIRAIRLATASDSRPRGRRISAKPGQFSPVAFPAAVLIRGTSNISGPGRITARLQIDKSLNGKPAKRSSSLWFDRRSIVIPDERIVTTPRIGVDYSGDWSQVPYRFILRE